VFRHTPGKIRLKLGGAEPGDILLDPIDRGTDEYSHDPSTPRPALTNRAQEKAGRCGRDDN
jgi:hypothetical protein